MAAPAIDRAAAVALTAALGSAVALVLMASWSDAADAPDHWARARWSMAPMLACAAAGGANALLAWRRRGEPARWTPLLGGALVSVAALLGRLAA